MLLVSKQWKSIQTLVIRKKGTNSKVSTYTSITYSSTMTVIMYDYSFENYLYILLFAAGI